MSLEETRPLVCAIERWCSVPATARGTAPVATAATVSLAAATVVDVSSGLTHTRIGGLRM